MLVFTIPFALWPMHLQAQKEGKERIDSLLQLLSHPGNDSFKVKTLNNISFLYHTIDIEKGFAYGEQSLLLAKKIGLKSGEAGAYNALAANYWVKHDYPTQGKYLFQALSINETINDTGETARTLRSIGDLYETEYNYPKAIFYFKKALALAIAIKDYDKILKNQANIANVYDAQKNYSDALAYFEKSIKLSEILNRPFGIAGYSRRAGLVKAEQGKFENALAYEKRALKIYRTLGDNNPYKDQLAWNLRDLGTVYFKQGNYKQSLVYFRQAYDEFIALPGFFATNNAGICLAKMGKTYLQIALDIPKQNQLHTLQLKHAQDTLQLAINMLKPRDWATLTEALQDLSTIYQLLGNDKAALDAFREYGVYKDSLYNTEIEKKVIIHEMEFESDRQKDSITHANMLQVAQLNFLMQQKELDRLRGRQQTIYIVIAFIAVCLFTFYFLYRNYLAKISLQGELAKERIEKKLEQAEHERNISRTTLTALISQMNPHFLFNALNTIQSFIYSNDKKNASSYLGKFSELTRKILDNSNKKSISLDEEIALLQLYLDIEKVRFGDNFIATVETDPTLDKEGIFFPPMLVQPYVENAIKHGLLHRQDKKEITIKIGSFEDGKEILIVIDDNGIGRERSVQLNAQKIGHRSFANTATEKRIDLINRGLDKKITFEIIDKKDINGAATGTKIILTIPIMTESLT